MIIEKANPPSEMRMIVIPLKYQEQTIDKLATQPKPLPLVSLNEGRSMVETIEPILERTLALTTEAEAVVAISEPETAPHTTPMPNLAIAPKTFLLPLTTAHTLLLLASGPQFDRTATLARSKPAKSSASQSHHTTTLLSEAPLNA